MTGLEGESGMPPKLDPETLAIRGQPPSVARFKRGAVVSIAAAGMVSLSLVSWAALRHRGEGVIPPPASQPQIASDHGAPLSALPSSYATVPRLGPPLPGDLGKPILEHQQALATGGNGDREREEAAAEGERQRVAAERKAARESGLLVQTATVMPLAPPSGQESAPSVSQRASHPLFDAGDPNGQQHKNEFVEDSQRDGAVKPHAVVAPASPYLLSAGSVITASLMTGLRSDLPGIVSAQVSENVYNSPTGRILLVPQGARLIGSYDSVVAFGQKRALVVWQRIILPDGSSLSLDNVPATDPSGYSGLEDKVDFHSWALLKGVAISTLLGVGAELQFTGGSDLVEAVRQSTQQSVSRAGDQLTSKALDIQPTIRVRAGAPVRLVVHKDLIFEPWRGKEGR